MNIEQQKRTATLAEKLLQSRKTSVADFGSIEHKLEHVDEINGVEYINDSKSTDLGATEYSLEYVNKPLVWIVSESEYEEDYDELKKLVTYKVIGIIAYGKDTSRIGRALSNQTDYFVDAPTLEEAVKLAHSFSTAGVGVIFSPAAPSFPAHENFKERGQAFRNAVAGLHTPEGRYEGEIFKR